MVCQAVLEAMQLQPIHSQIHIHYCHFWGFFLNTEVNSSHPVTQEKPPLNICFCCRGNWLLPLLADRWRGKGKREREREIEIEQALFFYCCRCILMRFDAN